MRLRIEGHTRNGTLCAIAELEPERGLTSKLRDHFEKLRNARIGKDLMRVLRTEGVEIVTVKEIEPCQATS